MRAVFGLRVPIVSLHAQVFQTGRLAPRSLVSRRQLWITRASLEQCTSPGRKYLNSLNEPLTAALESQNFQELTEIQMAAIPQLLHSRDTDFLLASHTGSGKTLAYLLPLGTVQELRVGGVPGVRKNNVTWKPHPGVHALHLLKRNMRSKTILECSSNPQGDRGGWNSDHAQEASCHRTGSHKRACRADLWRGQASVPFCQVPCQLPDRRYTRNGDEKSVGLTTNVEVPFKNTPPVPNRS